MRLGVVDVVYAPASVSEAAQLARDDGFDHLDVTGDGPVPAGLPVPVGDVTAFPSPRPGCSTPAPPDQPGMWERAVRAYRRCPGARIEAWGGSIIGSEARIRAFLAEVPDVRLLLDTGHVAGWGEDPCTLADVAGHVQLRQAAPGRVQLHPDEPDGTVDFAAVLARLDARGYDGLLSVEYFDLPDMGWPLADPRGHAVALAHHVRALA